MLKKKAQSVSEYTICVVAIILVGVAMQVYVKRGLQGRYAAVADFATTKAQAPTRQYEPYYQEEGFTITQNKAGTENMGKGEMNRVIADDMVERHGYSKETIN